jgi:hypothetical protein
VFVNDTDYWELGKEVSRQIIFQKYLFPFLWKEGANESFEGKSIFVAVGLKTNLFVCN